MAIDANILLNEGRCLSCNSGASESEIILLALLQRIAEAGGGGGGTPAAPLNSVQFNNAGAFGGSADLTFDDATNVLALTGSQTIAVGANTTALALSGYSLTGANAQSMVSLAGTWNTSGTPTAIDLNILDTASNASSALMKLRVGGADRASISKGGALTLNQGVLIGSGAVFQWSTRSALASFSNGNIILFNAATNDFSMLQFGGVAATFPGIKRSTTTLQVRLADDSAFANLSVLNVLSNLAATVITSSVALTNGAGAGAGTISNAPAAGNPTKWIGINDNGTIRYVPAW